MMLRLSPEQLEFLATAALEAFPEECCGLILGKAEGGGCRATRLIPSPNVTTGDPACTFEVDPMLRLRCERELRGGDEAIIGHYHSHPGGPAAPSKQDLALAFEPNLIWLIIGAAQDRVTGMGAYRLSPAGDGFDPVLLS